MTLLAFVLLPLVGGVLAWLAGRTSAAAARWVSIAVLAAGQVLSIVLWIGARPVVGSRWLAEAAWDWIPRFGVRLHLALDGLSLAMLALTFFLGLASVIASWRVEERVGFFHFNLLWVLAGVAGVFLAIDLFLFYFFWELMLVPMYFLIGIWGSANRTYAAIKFFIFTQASGLLMLVSILALAFARRAETGILSFGYEDLLGTSLTPQVGMWVMLGFLIAFAIKLPAIPLHTWLPDAHSEAPTAGSVVLAGLLLKTGAYGILRFVLPLFPEASGRIAPVAMTIGVVGILYGAVLAFGQTDLKRLVAYTSVSHLGFVMLGAFAFNELALQGTVMEMIAHGLSTGALFIIAGLLYERLHTRDMRRMGGLWAIAPKLGVATMFFAMASLGLPGLGNFVAEFLVLLGAFRADRVLAVLATIGLVAATIYSLWIVQRAFHGENREGWKITDLSAREAGVLLAMVIVLIWLGVYPQPVLDLVQPSLDGLRELAAGGRLVAGGTP